MKIILENFLGQTESPSELCREFPLFHVFAYQVSLCILIELFLIFQLKMKRVRNKVSLLEYSKCFRMQRSSWTKR